MGGGVREPVRLRGQNRFAKGEKTKPAGWAGFAMMGLGADSGRKRLAGRFRLNRKSTAQKGGTGDANSLQKPTPALALAGDEDSPCGYPAALA
jgi:hypothetical protein